MFAIFSAMKLNGQAQFTMNSLALNRLLIGLGSFMFVILLVTLLSNSPITGVLESETLRWRFEAGHLLSARRLSKDIIIIYINPPPGTGSSSSKYQTEDLMVSLVSKLEPGHPRVIGIDLNVDLPITARLKSTLAQHANIVLGISANTFITNELDQITNFGLRSLSSEGNEMVTQIPYQPNGGRDARAPISSGGTQSLKPFCQVVASRYQPAKVNNGLIAGLANDDLRLINYSGTVFSASKDAAIFAPDFNPNIFNDKIVLIGTYSPAYTIPGDRPRIHKFAKVSEVVVQAYAIQTLIDRSIIRASSAFLFRLMLCMLVVIALVMPLCPHVLRLGIFAIVVLTLVMGSYIALVWYHLFIQVWPFLIALVFSFIIGTVAYSVTDLQARNRQLRQTQMILEKRNVELEDAHTELEKRNKLVAQARELGMEEERQRIASDLHDDALKELFMASSVLEKSDDDGGTEPSVNMQARKKIHDASSKIRNIIANLSPSVLHVCGLAGAIENLADLLRHETTIEVSFKNDIPLILTCLSENQALIIYRIVQEAINNIQKHAGASQVSIEIKPIGHMAAIVIEDNGIGMNNDPARTDSYGLNNMRYRAELIGTKIYWNRSTKYSTGTQVTLEFETGNLTTAKS